ncbi:MAG: mannose-1-phosphate guanylyltransferase/mannose-6-phosphate isomerase [Micavibrio sp.]|nr:mannose-1-phosphate guanylyltransferase/mannose-6-phosphate isomerase [Micavibrio sp.]
MIPVILSGGSGTRLWPLSRKMYPKQFFPLVSDKTMFQETLLRVKDVAPKKPVIIANSEQRFMAAENLRQLDVDEFTILLEEQGRNTAPAIAAAAMQAMESDKDAVLLVLPADHTIGNLDALASASHKAEELARKGYLVVFGIKPDSPHTGYGYIESGKSIDDGALKLKNFKEKPDLETAKVYVSKDEYSWNSGMFVFKASVYLEQLRKFEPDIIKHVQEALNKGHEDLDFYRLDNDAFSKAKDISIDYAVMEKTDKGVVVPLDADWCDVGSWNSLWGVLSKDENGNVCKGDVLAHDSKNSYIHAENKLVATLGIEDLVIVDTKDALLVACKDRVDEVKNIVAELNSKGRKEGQHHRTVYRPWGHYDSIDFGARDQVKRITVNPGQKLSIQMHHHRAEHWIVVKGTAKVTKGEEQLMVSENQSVYLPLGVVHALENPGKIALELIEVQTGSYLGEDDIVRFEDLYGRS